MKEMDKADVTDSQFVNDSSLTTEGVRCDRVRFHEQMTALINSFKQKVLSG